MGLEEERIDPIPKSDNDRVECRRHVLSGPWTPENAGDNEAKNESNSS